ncbi:zinc ribbon domain-containing protein [Acetobacterium woodii]|uniref:Zinc-ribbon domain-containing protein n=1 Tax=Acetobacterium woodii (strain ATCC 29683 / DSM 1030 / JCM 2381 / KCTC 1655 / WB1) TaxID=931626 RepID=H6LK96_ACEWD|nr:zinc ribbon domain-containing protein [Acetobacterium woodii]AFA50016.1 hypothetical protein Awo_c32880 [Acetobacterium woodii DSM 1030]
MICVACGFEQNSDGNFCQNCGEPIKRIQVEEKDSCQKMSAVKENNLSEVIEKVSLNVTKDHKGGYQWMYEYSFWKNPAVLITTYKVLLIAGSFPAGLMFVLTLEAGIGPALKAFFTVIGITCGILMVLATFGYLLLGLLYGGKYYVLFKMDERGIHHIQLAKQFKKAQAMGFLTALIGLSGGNISAAGAGLMGATKQSLYTSFKKVKSVKINSKRHTIYLNESLTRNQIYADKEDFQFIKDYILKKCSKNVRVFGK